MFNSIGDNSNQQILFENSYSNHHLEDVSEIVVKQGVMGVLPSLPVVHSLTEKGEDSISMKKQIIYLTMLNLCQGYNGYPVDDI